MCGHHFLGNRRQFSSQRSVHNVVNLGGVVKTLRRGNSLSIVFLVRLGPLGTRPKDKRDKMAILLWKNRKRPVCPRNGVLVCPRTVPVCPAHRPAQTVYVDWLFLADSMAKFP